jgi:thymidylate synthase
MSNADNIFIDNCNDILQNGAWDYGFDIRPKWEDGEPAHTKRKFGIINRYDLSKEFPALSLRKLAFKSCIDEILWIWKNKSNNVNDLNSRIWDAWADDSGKIGKAYGYQLGIKHQYHEGAFDQVDRILYDLKNQPYSRRMIVNMYNHSDLYEMSLYPCAYSMTFNVSDKKLNAILNQRSQDFLVANNWNVCQYAVLLHMFAAASGLEVGELIHVISDAHIYDKHIPIVEELLNRKPLPPPKLIINPSIKDFYAFTVKDFELEDYSFHPLNQKIPVAI